MIVLFKHVKNVDLLYENQEAIYWINLDRSTERRKNMLTLLKDPI